MRISGQIIFQAEWKEPTLQVLNSHMTLAEYRVCSAILRSAGHYKSVWILPADAVYFFDSLGCRVSQTTWGQFWESHKHHIAHMLLEKQK